MDNNKHTVVDTLTNEVVMTGTMEQCSNYIITSKNPFLNLSL